MSFEVGDKVIDIRFGYGEVIAERSDQMEFKDFPVIVRFQNKHRTEISFTKDGRYTIEDYLPTLYHADGFVPPSAPEPYRCPFEEGDVVLVRDSIKYFWQCHVFKKYLGKGMPYPFSCADSHAYAQCIPLKGNAHLLDTDIEPEDDNNAN